MNLSKDGRDLCNTLIQRDQLWKTRTYPCIGLGYWLIPMISRSPAYNTILQRMKGGALFLDVGCFLGHDLRRLVFDGVPSTNLYPNIYGLDIVNHWSVGYELFRDSDRFFARFIEADIFAENAALLALQGCIDIVNMAHVLHIWDWERQVAAAKKVCSFTRPGSMVVGSQVGNVDAKDVVLEAIPTPQWRHNPASFQRLWDQVGVETGTEWKCQAWLRSWDDMGWDPQDLGWLEDGARGIEFVVIRSY